MRRGPWLRLLEAFALVQAFTSTKPASSGNHLLMLSTSTDVLTTQTVCVEYGAGSLGRPPGSRPRNRSGAARQKQLLSAVWRLSKH
jgi:hypothetical protein